MAATKLTIDLKDLKSTDTLATILAGITVTDDAAGTGTVDTTTGNITYGTKVIGKITVSGGNVTFTATADAPALSYVLTNSTEAADKLGFATVDASAMVGLISLDTSATAKNTLTTLTTSATAGVDLTSTLATYTKVTTITTGAGNDTISGLATTTTAINTGAGDDIVTVTGVTAASVTLGAGKDTVYAAAATAGAVTLTDYSAADDTLKLDSLSNASLTNAGVFIGKTSGASITGAATTANGLYKVTATDGSASEAFLTAKSGTSYATADASALTTAYAIDMTNATKAAVTLGSAGQNGFVTVGGANGTSITVGKAGGTVAVNGYATATAKNVLNLAGSLTVDGDQIESLGTTITGILKDAETATVRYTEKGNTSSVSTLGYIGKTSTTDIALVDATGTLTQYVNAGVAGDTTGINASAMTSAQEFRLTDTTKYTNIHSVNGSKGGGVYVGAGDSQYATTFDLSAATLASQAWAGGTNAGVDVTFKADNAVTDTLWLGSTDGNATVTGFAKGFDKKSSDVLYLYDVADAGNADYYNVTAGNAAVVNVDADTAVTLGGATATAAAGVQLNVKDAVGKINRVAVGVSDTAATIDGTDADYVIGKNSDALSNTVSYASTVKGQTYTVRLNNDTTGLTQYTNVANANLSGVYKDATVVAVGSGLTDGDTIVLGGKQADAWGGSAKSDTITLSTVSGAANTVWFGTTDGTDTVTNLTATGTTNTVYFYDQTLKQVAANYTYNAGFYNAKDSSNALVATGVTSATLNVKTTDASTKAVVGTTDLAYNKDASLYMGDGTATVSVSGTTGATIRLNNDSATYYSGVVSANASGVTAGEVVLVGNGTSSATLTGGYGTENQYWGAGSSADTFNGKAGIKDIFWFGTGDGNDTVATNVDDMDVVKLYNATSAADVTVAMGTDNKSFTVTLANDTTDSLTVADATKAAYNGKLTFQIGSTNYTYDSTTGKLK